MMDATLAALLNHIYELETALVTVTRQMEEEKAKNAQATQKEESVD